MASSRNFVWLIVVSLVVCVHSKRKKEVLTQPEQVHLSYGADPTEMVVTWVTQDSANGTVVEYGHDTLNSSATGFEEKFQDGGSQKRVFHVHRTVLRKLIPGMQYVYHVGSPTGGWSDLFFFKAMRPGHDWSPSFAVYGDMGNVNAKSLTRLQEETQKGHFDAILHVGDFAYDMDTDNARVGDAFMNQVQSVAAYIPYMTAVGNHEQAYNFSNYKTRFTMPGGDKQGMFYSVNIGPIHLVAFSSEFYYYVHYGWTQIVEQYSWLEKDLAEANRPENRALRPWIITMCHRPMYCSNLLSFDHCFNRDNLIRVGIPLLHAYGVEDLLYKYGVDVHFQAHEHSYERMWPVYNRTVCNGSHEEPYRNPRAPVHVVTGSAGCQEGTTPFVRHPLPWSAFHSTDYGYTRMKIFNATHLYMEQVSDDQNGKVIDQFTIVKDRHGPETFNCRNNNA